MTGNERALCALIALNTVGRAFLVASLDLPDTAVSPQNPDAQPIRTVLPERDVAEVALCRLLTKCEQDDTR